VILPGKKGEETVEEDSGNRHGIALGQKIAVDVILE
jgi:hypothetical protein